LTRPPGEPGTAARALAIEVLVRVEAGGYSNLVLPALLRASGLDGRDRALVTDLVYGTLRRQGQADFLLARVSHRPLARLDPPVRAALRLGAYQLLSGVAVHAAVGATVGALGAPPSPATARRAAPFVNAVLRRVADLGPDWPWPAGDDADAVAVRTSHPRWIVELLRRDLGDEADAVLAVANEPPPVTLRPNPLRTTPEALMAELTAAGVGVEPGRLVPTALLVRGVGDLARLPAVAEGRATPQDQASQAVATALGARPGERILDMAAAPGGKATALAEIIGDQGAVVAADLRPGRAGRVRDAALRLGLRSVQVLSADGRRLPLRPPGSAGGDGGRFDRVLLDAPCSGLGVLRRRPEARWRLEPAAIPLAAALQRELLVAALDRARPGGLVAYCVCTLTREETLDIDAWAASAFPGVVAVDGPGPPWRAHGRGALLPPSAAGTDGMFLLLLRAPPPSG
jgi:16S rRNA (cytosine967-C5)-methyltransferase